MQTGLAEIVDGFVEPIHALSIKFILACAHGLPEDCLGLARYLLGVRRRILHLNRLEQCFTDLRDSLNALTTQVMEGRRLSCESSQGLARQVSRSPAVSHSGRLMVP